MSNIGKEKICDFVQDNSLELLYAWLEQDYGWSEFIAWFLSKTSAEAREALMEKFIDDYKSKENIAFNEWAVQEAADRLSNINHDGGDDER